MEHEPFKRPRNRAICEHSYPKILNVLKAGAKSAWKFCR